MLETRTRTERILDRESTRACKVVVAWIDWYAYHVARFEALCDSPELAGSVAGLEMVGGTGVHSGLKFREAIPGNLPVTTLVPGGSWQTTGKRRLAQLIWKELNRLNPAVVLVPGYYNVAGFASALWAKFHGRRSVLMTESTEFDHGRIGWKESLKSLLIRMLFDWAIAGGKPHRRYLEKLGFPPARIASCYDVVNNRYFRRTAAAIRVKHRAHDFGLPDRYFLYVGRLAPEKNIDGLIGSYLEYRRAGGSWSLVLVGDGPEAKRLRALAGASPFGGDIYFEGLKTSKDLPAYYAFATCFVLPSKREPWGLVVNEAMAAGLPVLVSRLCGCAEDLVAHGENGYVFDPAMPDELTDCLGSFESLGSAACRQMGQRSSEIVDRYSPESWASEVARIVRSSQP